MVAEFQLYIDKALKIYVQFITYDLLKVNLKCFNIEKKMTIHHKNIYDLLVVIPLYKTSMLDSWYSVI